MPPERTPDLRERAVLSDAEVDRLARELIDPDTDLFSIAIGLEDFGRVQTRADEIEAEACA